MGLRSNIASRVAVPDLTNTVSAAVIAVIELSVTITGIFGTIEYHNRLICSALLRFVAGTTNLQFKASDKSFAVRKKAGPIKDTSLDLLPGSIATTVSVCENPSNALAGALSLNPVSGLISRAFG